MVKCEVLSLNIGQAGVQTGAEFWKYICHEEGIDPSSGTTVANSDIEYINHQPFFMETAGGTFIPQTVFVDSEDEVVDHCIRTGVMRSMLQRRGVTGNEDASNCFARGKFAVAKDIRSDALIAIRRTVEQMYHLHMIQLFSAISGGTGSGFTAALLTAMKDIFPKCRFEMHAVYPSGSVHDTIVEPYNSVFFMSQTAEMFDVRYTYDNESLNSLTEPVYKAEGMRASFKDLNYLISLVPSCMSACSRFGSGDSMSALGVNLVPFRSLNAAAVGIVPLFHRESQMAISEHSLLSEAFLNRVEMCSLDTFEGKYISACLFYRGSLNIPYEYHNYIREKIDFVHWIPTGIKYDVAPKAIVHPSSKNMYLQSHMSLLKVSNHTGITEQLTSSILDRYSSLLSKRAYIFWYVGEGMEEGEFEDAKEKLESEIETARNLSGPAGNE